MAECAWWGEVGVSGVSASSTAAVGRVGKHWLALRSGANLFMHSLELDEPEKSVVKSWRKGANPLPPRCTVVVIRFRGESRVLGEGNGVVTPLHVPASGYPMMSMDEQTSLSFALFKDAAFNASIRRRGGDAAFNASLRRRGVRASDVACLPISFG
uniref:Amine oxidase n=1 Tax=Oryza barthii TaxID=65489 RepID=A0A0D3FWT1_9ORYZ